MERRNKVIALCLVSILIGTYFLYYSRFPNLLHGPITIESNEDFEDQGWNGNGTVNNPYIISGLTIYSEDYCIKIMDTTAHFTIKNCYLETGRSATGSVWFNQTFNGKIENCEIVSGVTCLRLDNARNYKISNNDIHGTTVFASGINAYSGSGGFFEGNFIHHLGQVHFQSVDYVEWYSNYWEPLDLYSGWFVFRDVEHLRIGDCTFVSGHVYLPGASDVRVVNCEFERAGLRFQGTSHVFVSNTTIKYYSGYGTQVVGTDFDGVYVAYCEDITITNTSVIGCDRSGITCIGVDGLSIVDCNVNDNSRCGLNLSYVATARIQAVNSYDNGGIGLAIVGGCDTVNVVDCRIYNNSDHGVVSDGEHTNTYSISISYCEIFGNDGNGVFYHYNVLGSIYCNSIHDNEEWGIYIDACHNWINLSGNTVVNNQAGDIGP